MQKPRTFGDSRFLLVAAFSFFLLATVSTAKDILYFGFDVQLATMFIEVLGGDLG